MKAEDRLQEIIKSGEISSLDAAKQEGFIKGWNEALRIHDVVRQSEQLVCSCGSIKVQTTGGLQCPNNRCSLAN